MLGHYPSPHVAGSVPFGSQRSGVYPTVTKGNSIALGRRYRLNANNTLYEINSRIYIAVFYTRSLWEIINLDRHERASNQKKEFDIELALRADMTNEEYWA